MKKGILYALIVVLSFSSLLSFSSCVCKHENIMVDYSVEATCTESGLTAGRHCLDCGEVLQAQQVIPATGHNIVTKKGYAATCQSTGLTDGKYCSNCNYVSVNQEVISKTGHNLVTKKGTSATCQSTGLTDGQQCSYCNYVSKKQTVIPKIDCVSGSNGYCVMCNGIAFPYLIVANYVQKNGKFSEDHYTYSYSLPSTSSTVEYTLGIFYYPNSNEITVAVLLESSSVTLFLELIDFAGKSDMTEVVAVVEYSGYSGEDYASGYIYKSVTSSDFAYIFDFYYVPAVSYTLEDSVNDLMENAIKVAVVAFDSFVVEKIDKNLRVTDFGFESN